MSLFQVTIHSYKLKIHSLFFKIGSIFTLKNLESTKNTE